jgi:hypothetical protein
MESELTCDPLAQELCRLARQYAFLCAAETVDAQHLLLAAIEVTPGDWHGCPQLTRARLLDAMEGVLGEGTELSDRRPSRLSPSALYVLGGAAAKASQRGSPASCRDIWVALLEDSRGMGCFLIKRLGIDPTELRHRFGNESSNTA